MIKYDARGGGGGGAARVARDRSKLLGDVITKFHPTATARGALPGNERAHPPRPLRRRARRAHVSFAKSTRTMARYEQLVADDEIAARGAAHVDIVAQQERAKKRKLFREKIERLLWVLVSAFLVWFGDGTGNLGQIMLQRANDTR